MKKEEYIKRLRSNEEIYITRKKMSFFVYFFIYFKLRGLLKIENYFFFVIPLVLLFLLILPRMREF